MPGCSGSQWKAGRIRATGVYSENLVLRAEVSLYGGYSADFTVHDTVIYVTAISGRSRTGYVAGTVRNGITNGNLGTRMDGFLVFGANATTAGASSPIYHQLRRLVSVHEQSGIRWERCNRFTHSGLGWSNGNNGASGSSGAISGQFGSQFTNGGNGGNLAGRSMSREKVETVCVEL